MRKVPALLLLSCFLWTSAHQVCNAQQRNRVGITLGLDKASTDVARGVFGLSLERMLNSQNSIEAGFYYRHNIDDNLTIQSPSGSNFVTTEQYFILEKFITVPLTYNYNSKFATISIGPSVDFYVGWKEKKHITNPPSAFVVPLQKYLFDHKILWGAIGRISKNIKMGPRIMLVPCVYYNPIFTSYDLYSKYASETRQYYGATLSVRYIF